VIILRSLKLPCKIIVHSCYSVYMIEYWQSPSIQAMIGFLWGKMTDNNMWYLKLKYLTAVCWTHCNLAILHRVITFHLCLYRAAIKLDRFLFYFSYLRMSCSKKVSQSLWRSGRFGYGLKEHWLLHADFLGEKYWKPCPTHWIQYVWEWRLLPQIYLSLRAQQCE